MGSPLDDKVVCIAFSHRSGCDSHSQQAADILAACGSGSPCTSTGTKHETPR
jgi:hypothetical protein